MRLAVEYILAHNDKKTPYHWINIFDADVSNGGVFVLRAWGKRPNQVKSIAFKSAAQCRAYHEKWQQDKSVERRESLGEFDTPEKIAEKIERFPWLDMKEYEGELCGLFGVMNYNAPQINTKSTVPPSPARQLSESYGWW